MLELEIQVEVLAPLITLKTDLDALQDSGILDFGVIPSGFGT